MIFTTSKHPKRWGAALHDDLAEAIVDRILERSRLLRLDGPSVRTKHLRGDELADDDQDDSRSSKVPEGRPQSFRNVHGLGGGQWVAVDTFEGEATVCAEPFDAIELPLTSLWAH
jgi:hypothetical protein